MCVPLLSAFRPGRTARMDAKGLEMPSISRQGDDDKRALRIGNDDPAGADPAPGDATREHCGRDALAETTPANIGGFARGTRIGTPSGDVPIEDLSAGDLVQTRDRGPQPLRWIGSHVIAATRDNTPVTIRKGTLGTDRDLLVGAGHRLLLCDWRADLMFEEPEVLAVARHLTGEPGIHQDDAGQVEFFLMLFDNHEIVTAMGAFAESFHPGEHGIHWLPRMDREAIVQCFPMLLDKTRSWGPLVRPSLKRHETRAIRR